MILFISAQLLIDDLINKAGFWIAPKLSDQILIQQKTLHLYRSTYGY